MLFKCFVHIVDTLTSREIQCTAFQKDSVSLKAVLADCSNIRKQDSARLNILEIKSITIAHWRSTLTFSVIFYYS